MKQEWHIRYAEIFKALGHPVRLCIVDGLMRNSCNVGKMVDKLGIPQATVSQHLAVLRNCRIIVPEKTGVKTCYRVTDENVRQIVELLRRAHNKE